jgi:predicted transcriptional regulator
MLKNGLKFVLEIKDQNTMRPIWKKLQPYTITQTQFFSIYRDQANDVAKILSDLKLQYMVVGEDQSERIILAITYTKSEEVNIATIQQGIRDLERGKHLAELIIAGVTDLINYAKQF